MPFIDTISLKSYTEIFLESGTFHGAGVKKAISAGFKKVISIEIFQRLYEENLERFSTEISNGQVEIHLGDSADIIGDLVSKIAQPITFWFDAHDQTMNDAGVGKFKCPIVQELKSLINSRNKQERYLDILFIDDMRLIENKNAGWAVDIGSLYSTIWEYNPDFNLSRVEGHIPHDILKCANRFLR